MNSQSIHFRLIVWYAGVLLLVLIGFGAFTYTTLRFYSHQVLHETMSHRAQQIADLLASDAAAKDPEFVGREVTKRYDPATNDRLVRVTHADGRLLYLSAPPVNHSFAPEQIPALRGLPE